MENELKREVDFIAISEYDDASFQARVLELLRSGYKIVNSGVNYNQEYNEALHWAHMVKDVVNIKDND